MSVSPPKDEVETGDQSPDNSEHMDRGDTEAQAREPAYEFEVKEQDRWLPIANGWFSPREFMNHPITIACKLPNCMKMGDSDIIA